MQRTNSPSSWKRWLKLSRLIPLITILSAGLINAASLVGLLKLTGPEAVIIALLALLAVDSLVERMSILERLEHKFSALTSIQSLNNRTVMPKPSDQARHASEICILAVSAHFVISQYITFYENKLRNGCNLRIIVLNPQSSSLQSWELLTQSTITESHIKGTLAILDAIVKKDGIKGKCEVRLSELQYPFSVFGVDMDRESGSMVVEYYSYKVHVDERAHVQLSATGNAGWFNFYRQQFEHAWSEAQPWGIQNRSADHKVAT